jgi:hypothetical protein
MHRTHQRHFISHCGQTGLVYSSTRRLRHLALPTSPLRVWQPEPAFDNSTTNTTLPVQNLLLSPTSSLRRRVTSSVDYFNLKNTRSTLVSDVRYPESIVQNDYYGESTRFQVEIQSSGLYSLSSALCEHLLVTLTSSAGASLGRVELVVTQGRALPQPRAESTSTSSSSFFIFTTHVQLQIILSGISY